MKINNNISAVISNKHLLRSENALSMSMERLSSGFRINHAVDDPSGIAISNKMNAQIDGLSRSSRNASDGISVLDTADGALGEITSMIQRMRELSVQAANDLNTQSDKAAIQQAADAKAAELGYSEGYSLKEMPKKDADAIRAVKRRMYAEYTPTAEQEAMIREAETMDESMYKTAEGLAELKKNYPMVFDAYTTMVRNATKSKGLESDVPFYARDTYDTISDKS